VSVANIVGLVLFRPHRTFASVRPLIFPERFLMSGTAAGVWRFLALLIVALVAVPRAASATTCTASTAPEKHFAHRNDSSTG